MSEEPHIPTNDDFCEGMDISKTMSGEKELTAIPRFLHRGKEVVYLLDAQDKITELQKEIEEHERANRAGIVAYELASKRALAHSKNEKNLKVENEKLTKELKEMKSSCKNYHYCVNGIQ
jgi:hypothetical protein